MNLLKMARRESNHDLLLGIAPIFRVDPCSSAAVLVGTGFWVTEHGHLVTAKHVVEENIDKGTDKGEIFAIQTFADRSTLARSFHRTSMHKLADLALCETHEPVPGEEHRTMPLTLSLSPLRLNDPVGSFAVLSPEETFLGERHSGISPHRYRGWLQSEDGSRGSVCVFDVRASRGRVEQLFPAGRDRVVMPSPCVQTDIPIYGGNSGGPMLNSSGHVCAINCTNIREAQVSFHTLVVETLQLWIEDVALIPEDPTPRPRTVLELALARRVRFSPHISREFFSWWQLALMWPIHYLQDLRAWATWRARSSRDRG